jgi:NadR type nicotinamide-nucleotide adenylyltransferase
LEALTRICLTGAECTGKSRLAAELARHFGTVWIPEYAREYAERVARPLTYLDVVAIAEGQMALEERTVSTRLAILDTDLISTVVYSRHHYGACPEWIEAEAHKRRADLYLLLDIDVPWLADGARDSGARRDELYEEFRRALEEFGAEYVLISGTWEERRQRAIEAVRGARTASDDGLR